MSNISFTIATVCYNAADTIERTLHSVGAQEYPFVEHLRSYHRVPKIGKGIVIASEKDSIVPTELSERLATWLHCEFVRLPVAGHFLDREGYTQFPEVRDKVLEIFREEK